MSTETVETVTVDYFRSLCAEYGSIRKLFDAVNAIDPSKLADALSRVEALRDNLEHVVETGAGVTLPKSAGFGSENAANVASAILGRRTSTSRIKSAAVKFGK